MNGTSVCVCVIDSLIFCHVKQSLSLNDVIWMHTNNQNKKRRRRRTQYASISDELAGSGPSQACMI